VVANLPYNIAAPLLTRWVEAEPWPPWFERLTLMFQREVAERIVATPRQRAAYGRLSVLCGWRTQARILFDIPPSAFTPPPKVTSSVVELTPRARPSVCDPRALSAATQAAFGQRRKMLRQSLRTLNQLGYDVDAAALLERAGLDPTLRAEQIEVEDFVRLARLIAPAQRRQPPRQPGPQQQPQAGPKIGATTTGAGST
jgi:16S rRNA (adenine1518-N6/adenine1519-N6)-dimethyltransferase